MAPLLKLFWKYWPMGLPVLAVAALVAHAITQWDNQPDDPRDDWLDPFGKGRQQDWLNGGPEPSLVEPKRQAIQSSAKTDASREPSTPQETARPIGATGESWGRQAWRQLVDMLNYHGVPQFSQYILIFVVLFILVNCLLVSVFFMRPS